MHFIGAVGQAQAACADIGMCQERMLQTFSSERLNGAVNDRHCHARRDDFNHADIILGGFVAVRIQSGGGIQGQ